MGGLKSLPRRAGCLDANANMGGEDDEFEFGGIRKCEGN